MNASSGDYKEGSTSSRDEEALSVLGGLNPVKFASQGPRESVGNLSADDLSRG
jgi:hypothetical protein